MKEKYCLFSFIQHLKRKHPEEYKACEQERKEDEARHPPRKKQQLTLSEAISKTQKYGHSSARQKQIDKYVIDMIAMDMQPASVVEDAGFKRLVTLLDSRYEIPSRRTILRMLPEKYRQVRATVEVLLAETCTFLKQQTFGPQGQRNPTLH